MNNDKKKIYGMILGVLAFIVLIAGVTFAWFTFSTNNTNINGTTGCFNITYTNGTNITGGIDLSSSFTGGRYTTATIGLAAGCISGTTTLSLVTEGSTTAALLTSGALKYAFTNNNATPVALGVTGSTGVISAAGTKSVEVALTPGTTVTYRIYVWVDGSVATNAIIGSSYTGHIGASAVQSHS